MHRILLTIGPFEIPSYGVMQLIAWLVGIYLATKEAKRNGVDPNKVTDLCVYLLISAIIGSRIWYVVEHWREFSHNILGIFKIWEGGAVFYGGFILAFIVGMWFIKLQKLDFNRIGDIMASSLAIGVGIGRIGCFLDGCCYGKISYRFGIPFPAANFPPPFEQQLRDGLISANSTHSLPVIPTQLYSSVDGFAIFFLLLWLKRYKTFDGFLFWTFVLLYSIHRLVIDFFRYYEGNALIF